MKKLLLLTLSAALAAGGFSASAAKKAARVAAPEKKVAKAPNRTDKSLSHTVILEIPEGTTTTYSSAYSGITLDWNLFAYVQTHNAGFVTEVTECADNVYYLKNSFAVQESPTISYVKGVREGDKIVVPNMYCNGGFSDDDDEGDYDEDEDYYRGPNRADGDDEWTYGENGMYVYLAVMMKDPDAEDGEINFIVDRTVDSFSYTINADGTITLDLPADRWLGECYESGEWIGMAMKEQTMTPCSPTAISELPDGLTPEKWVLSGAADARFVSVAISGNDIYIGNIDSDLPAYIKGSIDGTKVTIPSGQFIGINEEYNFFTYIWGGVLGTYDDPDTGESYPDYLKTDNITFLYDAGAKTLTGDENEGLFVNLGTADYIYYLAMYAPASIKWQNPDVKPGNPKDPIITACYFDDFYGFNILDFDLPKTDVNGNLLDVEKMYYNFYCNEKVFTFYSDEYVILEIEGIEEMTDVPYTYSDMFDLFFLGGQGVSHPLSFFFSDADSVGLRLFYKDDEGNVLASNYVGYDMALVKNLADDAEAVATIYYDLMGRRVAEPKQGLYIKQTVYSDGQCKAVKEILH